MISVLCCHSRSVYKSIKGVDCYDKKRDVFTFDGDNPIIAHPPCRTFSKLRTMVVDPGRDSEIASFVIDKLRRNGGILEQPARSLMREIYSLGNPFYVDQGWFGYPLSKPTWLWFFDCEPKPLPYKLGLKSLGKEFANMSYYQRSATPRLFAEYLISCVKGGECYAP
jgi:hypothetical protein